MSWQRYWYTNRIGERPLRWKSVQCIDLCFYIHLNIFYTLNTKVTSTRKCKECILKPSSIPFWLNSSFLLRDWKNRNTSFSLSNPAKEETRNKKRAQTKSHNKIHARSIRRPLLLACTNFLRPFLSSYCFYIYSHNISELCFSYIAFIF